MVDIEVVVPVSVCEIPVVVAVDEEDIIGITVFKSANAEAICKHTVGVNSIACLGDNIAPKKGCDFVVNRVVVVGVVVVDVVVVAAVDVVVDGSCIGVVLSSAEAVVVLVVLV